MALPASTTTTTTNATSTNSLSSSSSSHNKPTKLKRRKCRDITVSAKSDSFSSTSSNSSSGSHVFSNRKLDHPPVIVSSENSWCCPATKPSVTPAVLPPPPPPPPFPPSKSRRGVVSPTPTNGNRASDSVVSPSDSPSTFRIRFSPGSFSPVMDFTTSSSANAAVAAGFNGHSGSNHDSFPSSFSKFNSALTAGLLNPMSPPPSTDKTRSSPTLFEMMASEPDIHPRTSQIPSHSAPVSVHKNQIPIQDKQAVMMQRISELLGSRSPGNQFNDASSSDIKLTLSSRDGISVSMNVHRQILVAHSRFFALKLSERWAKQQRSPSPYIVEIADCDDVEVYIETLKLMYCRDLRKKLMKEDVPRVLGVLKV